MSVNAGSAAHSAAAKKDAKYALSSHYHFVPITCETLGPLNFTAVNFLSDLGRRIAAVCGDSCEGCFLLQCEGCFLLQCMSVALQPFNPICFHGSLSSYLTPKASRSELCFYLLMLLSRPGMQNQVIEKKYLKESPIFPLSMNSS